MGFVKSSSQILDIPNNKDYTEKFRYIQLFMQDVQQVLNGGVELSNNILLSSVEVAFSAANTDTAINHGLGRAPRGYFIVSRNAAMIIYDGSVASTSSTITLKSSAVGTAKIVFL